MLTEINDGGRPYFTVIDRRTIQNAMTELKLQQTGLVDEKSISRLGKFVGVSGIYAGSANISSPVDKRHQEKRFVCSDIKCKNKREVTITCTERLVRYTLAPRLVEVETSKVIYQRSIDKTQSASFCEESVSTSSEVLTDSAREQAFAEVRKDIAPYAQAQSLPLKTSTDGLTGDAKAQFSNSLAFAKTGRMDRACAMWSDLAAQNLTTLDVMYDLAVCDEAAGDLQKALNQYTAIDNSLSRPDDDLNVALQRVRKRIADTVALTAQTGVPDVQSVAPATGPAVGAKVPKSAKGAW